MNQKVLFNGVESDWSQISLIHGYRAWAYGDGFFETMRMVKGEIPLLKYHLQRLQFSCELLGLEMPVSLNEVQFMNSLKSSIKIHQNELLKLRLQCWRKGDAGYYSESKDLFWLLQADAFTEQIKPLKAVIYTEQTKASGRLSALKSNNALLYTEAQQHARNQGADEAVILNQFNRVAETSHYNIFAWIDGELWTPPLSEGPVAGVMRNFLIKNYRAPLREEPLTIEMLRNAESVAVTNALQGIRWIEELEGRFYNNSLKEKLSSFLKLNTPGFTV